MNIENILQCYTLSKSLEPFENSKTQGAFWDNDHISKMMLMAHLNPQLDAASRRPTTMDATCNWIVSTFNLQPGNTLLDLGCGPGLYCTRFYDKGLNVTGIDYSARSIAYAKEQAQLHQQAIEYRYENYLNMDYTEAFDAVVMIYCDFSVLSQEKRAHILTKVHKALKPGGYFIFDVWSTSYEALTKDYKSWNIHPDQGFWKPYPHVELILQQYNPQTHLALKQHLILQDKADTEVYNLWEQCYAPEHIQELLSDHGFRTLRINSDLMGTLLKPDADTLGVVAQKPL